MASTPDEAKAFPLPSSIGVVPGTEGAQAAYPYYTAFVPGDDQKFWFYNSMHFPEPMHHFDMITAEAAYVALGAANTRVHVLPTAKGIEHRVINGRVYIGGVSVTDPVEIAERVGGNMPISSCLPQRRQRDEDSRAWGAGQMRSGIVRLCDANGRRE